MTPGRQAVYDWQTENIGRRKPDGELDWGYVCETCGLSDWGFARFKRNGFPPNPCTRCIDHFYPNPLPTEEQ